MTDSLEPAALPTENAIDPKPVEAFFQALVKGARAAQLYLPNNPVFQQAIANIRDAFGPIWAGAPEVKLDIKETAFVLGAHPVLDQPQKTESLAWILYKDGVRSLTLRPGAEDEIMRLLALLNKARNLPPDADDDLLTLLWEEDFQSIGYRHVELVTEDARPLEPDEEPAEPGEKRTQSTQENVAEETKRPEGLINLEEFDSTLYFLDEKDIAYLRDEIEREYQQDLRSNVLAILFDIFELQTFSTVRSEVLSIIENFIPYLLGAGDFRSVSYILRELRVATSRARELTPEHVTQVEELPARLSEPAAVSQLLQSLDEAAVHPSEDELGSLFRELRPEALETVLSWMPRLTNARVRELLQQAVQRLATQNPEELAKALGSEDEGVVYETIKLAQLLKLPPLVPALGGVLVTDRSPALKVAVVDCLAVVGSPSAMQQLERAVDDGHRDVRVAAVRTLGQRRHRAAMARIEPMVTGKMKNADLTEKMAFFEAYGLLVGPDGITRLKPMLSAGGFMKKGNDPQTRACAAMALGKIGTPEARAALQDVANDKDPLVRNAVNKALREIG